MEKDHLEILLEDMHGKFDLIIEGHAALDRKIDNKFEELNEKIAFNSFKIDALNTKIDGVEAKLSQKIDDVETKLTQKINAVETKLTQKIDAVETKLTQKIDGVEAKLSQKIDGVAADLKATDARLSAKIDGVAVDLSAHRADTELHHGVYQVKDPSAC